MLCYDDDRQLETHQLVMVHAMLHDKNDYTYYIAEYYSKSKFMMDCSLCCKFPDLKCKGRTLFYCCTINRTDMSQKHVSSVALYLLLIKIHNARVHSMPIVK